MGGRQALENEHGANEARTTLCDCSLFSSILVIRLILLNFIRGGLFFPILLHDVDDIKDQLQDCQSFSKNIEIGKIIPLAVF